jgi:hypothetical protein
MKKISAALPVALAAGLAPASAMAYELTTVGALTQSEFRLLSEDLGAAFSYKPLVPSEATGLLGFDFGIGVTGTALDNAILLSKASNGASVHTTLPMVSARFYKGLPFDIDVAANYTVAPEAHINAFGGEVRWAFLPGTTTVPAVAIRGSGSMTNGVDQLDLSTYGVDISVSKGFAIFTPYGGIGQVWVRSTPNGAAKATLSEEKFNMTKFFLGINVNIGVNFAFEYDNTGGINSYGAKVGFRF